jgi:hypothetical protein
MFSSGKTKRKTMIRITLLLVSFIYYSCSSSDVSRDRLKSRPDSEFHKMYKDVKKESPFVPSYQKEEIEQSPRKKSSFIPMGMEDEDLVLKYNKSVVAKDLISGSEVVKNEKPLESKKYSGLMPMGTLKNDQYLEAKNTEIIEKYENKGRSNFSLSYYLVDNFKVEDEGNTYNSIFKDDTEAKNSGLLLFSMTNYLSKGRVNLGVAVNAGVSYHNGRGVFADGTRSDAKFTVWMIPLDLGVSANIPMSRFLRFSFAGGPSAMGLMQTRDDKESGEKYKRRRQVGTGFFGMAKMQVSLSSLMPSLAPTMYGNYSVSQFYLNLEARMHNYSRFQDDIDISGSSIGLGLTFDYL